MDWNPQAEEKFKALVHKLPFIHRKIAEKMVTDKAAELANRRNSQTIEEEDVAKAFISESPAIFKQQMFSLMDDVGFDYKKLI